uniref:Zgc:162780 n=1 Tax=Seriola lalandi dorsalis TaxID=1841481 RepID=A0A3B4YY36_SERLL
MAYRLFEGKEHAASYCKYRISPSDHLIQQVLDFLEKQVRFITRCRPFELAVDVGCGSGQGTLLLAKHFASVVGTDVSPAQLEVALQHVKEPNITYKQCVAEELPFADSSVDLMTAMSAFHWFDRPRFLREAHRVLKPRGCLALLNYTIDMELSHPDCCSHTLNRVCKEVLTEYSPERGDSECALKHTQPHLQECVWVRRPMPLSSYMGLVESFSSYQALLRDDPQKATSLSQDTCQRLMTIMKVTSAETEVAVAVKYFYLLACKPEEA